ncbi:MAG: hypothetical protein NZM38_08925, partial [Cytophagales bacterium]|nr:hypothetical protein [Cytophagales bacterium]MDW8384882.1 hypothetical protein [Flammeovirgaceae bacterium]
LHQNRDLLKKISVQARQKASEYAYEKCFARWLSLFDEINTQPVFPASFQPNVVLPAEIYPAFAQEDIRQPTWWLRTKQYTSYYTHRLRKLIGL